MIDKERKKESVMKVEKEMRTQEYFATIEREKEGSLWNIVKTEKLTALEKRYVSYAFKEIIEEKLNKKVDDQHDLDGVSTEYLKGLLLSVAKKADITQLVEDKPLSIPCMESLKKKAYHAGRIYRFAIDQYIWREKLIEKYEAEGGRRSQKDYMLTNKQDDRYEMQKRALRVAKTVDIARAMTLQNPALSGYSDLHYRQVVVSLLPKDRHNLYMLNPTLQISKEDLEKAFITGSKCGSSYAVFVEKYRLALEENMIKQTWTPNYQILLSDPQKMGLQKLEDVMVRTASPANTGIKAPIYAEDSEYEELAYKQLKEGIWVWIDQAMNIHYPAYTEMLEDVLYKLYKSYDEDGYKVYSKLSTDNDFLEKLQKTVIKLQDYNLDEGYYYTTGKIIFEEEAGGGYTFNVESENKQFAERLRELLKKDPDAKLSSFEQDKLDSNLYKAMHELPINCDTVVAEEVRPGLLEVQFKYDCFPSEYEALLYVTPDSIKIDPSTKPEIIAEIEPYLYPSIIR